MTNRQTLILFLIGSILVIFGAVFKIQHWPGASFLLIIGLTFEAVSIFILIKKLWDRDKSNRGFFDS